MFILEFIVLIGRSISVFETFLKLFVEKDDVVKLSFCFILYEFISLTRLLFEVLGFFISILLEGSSEESREFFKIYFRFFVFFENEN